MRYILAVDDDPQLLTSVCRLLQAYGHDVRGVGDGEGALAAMRADPPGLVLLDVSMPGLSGFDVLRSARADPALTGVPIIMVTASAASTRDDALRLGAADWLAKGQGWPDALLRAVERFVVASP